MAQAAPQLLPETASLSADSQKQAGELMADPDWSAQLIDPVFSSAKAIDARAVELSSLYTCLDQEKGTLTPDLQELHRLLGYFLAFTGHGGPPSGGSALHLVDPATSDDPAVRKIRVTAGVPPPPGLFFVRLYPSRPAMPAPVRAAFAKENIVGVTIYTRYIAVPIEEKSFWAEQALQAQTLPETISHELIHAYVNASFGADHLPGMPDWYSEGLAIYFSGSGEQHAVQAPGYSLVVTSPEDYRQYDLNFRYLESLFGRERLLELIRQSIATKDPQLLLREASFPDEQALVDRANTWAVRRFTLRLSAVLGAVLALAWGIAIYFRRFPDAWCIHCDYGGKWRDFKGGLCPRCGLPFNKPVEDIPPEELPSTK
jgi:hypothetical protein